MNINFYPQPPSNFGLTGKTLLEFIRPNFEKSSSN